ncbi:unnamed protein product [Penicillium pancosmium]
MSEPRYDRSRGTNATSPGQLRATSAPAILQRGPGTKGPRNSDLADPIDSFYQGLTGPETSAGGAQPALGSPFMTPIRHYIPATHGPFSPDEALAEAQERIRVLEHCYGDLQRQIEQLQFQMEGQKSRYAAVEYHIANLSQRLANLTAYAVEFVNRLWNRTPGTA